MSEKENMNEKDKLYRTIRRLLIIGAITLAVLFIVAIMANIVLVRHTFPIKP